jgi:hypothetical protein
MAEMRNVLAALADSRRALRRAAQAAGDRRVAHRLWRLARRRRAAVRDLHRAGPTPDGPGSRSDADRSFINEMHAASEIGATAACLRANRRLRAAIEATLDADPPHRVGSRLERLRDQTDHEAATFNARLRELVVATTPVGPTATSPSGPAMSPYS